MQEVLHAFGIDWRLIVIQIFNFTLLMGALWYFLYTPVLKLLADRQQKIATGIEDAEAAARVRAEAETGKAKLLTSAHEEAERVLARGAAEAKVQSGTLAASAEAKAAQIVRAAEEKGAELQTAAIKASEAEVAKLAILAAEKILIERT